MYYEENSRTFNFVVGMALGLALGAGLALLIAPQSGRRTRRRIVRAVAGAREEIGERWDDVSGDVRTAVGASRRRLGL